ncbi:MAG: hypothetical protein QM820_56980 [Minicystis sp.]
MPSTVRPVLRVNPTSTASVLVRAYAIHNGMAADTTRFAAPNPPLAALQAQIVKVEDAEKQARARTKGAAKMRDFERERLFHMLGSECAYVKTLCDAAPEEASLIIQAAGLVSAAARVYTKPALRVTPGAAPGTVDSRRRHRRPPGRAEHQEQGLSLAVDRRRRQDLQRRARDAHGEDHRREPAAADGARLPQQGHHRHEPGWVEPDRERRHPLIRPAAARVAPRPRAARRPIDAERPALAIISRPPMN